MSSIRHCPNMHRDQCTGVHQDTLEWNPLNSHGSSSPQCSVELCIVLVDVIREQNFPVIGYISRGIDDKDGHRGAFSAVSGRLHPMGMIAHGRASWSLLLCIVPHVS